MNMYRFTVGFAFAKVLLIGVAIAAGAPPPEQGTADALKDQIQKLQDQLEHLQLRVAELESGKTNLPSPAVPALPAAGEPAPVRAAGWSPAEPITVARSGSTYVDISFDVMANVGWSTAQNDEVRTGHHAPYERGFSLRSAELALEGAVDPYFKALSTIAFALDRDGETVVEVEEAYAQTTSLPWNLQIKAGQFYAPFGRQNTQHAHEWAFVDQPIVLNRFFGPDGLRQPGAQLSWLVPMPFFTELALGVFNNRNTSFVAGSAHAHEDGAEQHGYSLLHGGEPVERKLRGPGDLVFVPRLCASFELSDTQTLLGGISAAFGPNDSGPHADTQIYGLDLYWKWRPERAEAGFPFVSFQTEGLYRRYEAAQRIGDTTELSAETLHDWGVYGQLLWGFKRRWVAGLRAEFASGDDAGFDSPVRADRFRLSPNLTFYPTEYSKLRLQYNYDNRHGAGTDHSVWAQLEFMLGAHAAHKF